MYDGHAIIYKSNTPNSNLMKTRILILASVLLMTAILSSCSSGSSGKNFIGTWKLDHPTWENYRIITQLTPTEFLVVSERRNLIGLGSERETERDKETYTLVDDRLEFFNGAAKYVINGNEMFDEKGQKFIKQ